MKMGEKRGEGWERGEADRTQKDNEISEANKKLNLKL